MRTRYVAWPIPAVLISALFAFAAPLRASWIEDGTPVCAETGDQNAPKAVSDGAGGAIVAWVDARRGGRDIYAQRIDATGVVRWTEGGVAVCTASGYSLFMQAASDGAGGAIIVWQDDRSGYDGVYAQRIDSEGTARWTMNGVAVCASSGYFPYPKVAADGSGGAIIAWLDSRSGQDDNVYAQRVDASGTARWTTNGIAVCSEAEDQGNAVIVSDGAGGAIIAWSDDRNPDSDIYAQRIDSTGAALWTDDGVPVCTDAGHQYHPRLACDGAEGAIVSWAQPGSEGYRIYAQRVDSAGTVHWTGGSVAVCSEPYRQWFSHGIACDGAEGAIVTWFDSRSGDWNIYAQRVDSSGAVRWNPVGVDVCTASGPQTDPLIIPDGAGGGIIAWEDERNGNEDIYVQRIDSAGSVRWAVDGLPVCTTPDDQRTPAVVSDGAGWGAIIAWADLRGSNCDIYAQYVCGPPSPGASIVEPWDTYGRALAVPGAGASPDSVAVILRDELGAPVRHAQVGIDITRCVELCIDSPDGLTEAADEHGRALLNPRVGGCSACDVLILANGSEIRSYPRINSPDWDGIWANGIVNMNDIAYITLMVGTSDACADLNGDGIVDLADLNLAYLCLHESNDVTCPYFACEVEPLSIDFDTVLTGTEHDAVFVIRNTGGGALAGTVAESCDWCSIISGGGAYSIPRGDSLVVALRCVPADTGSHVCAVETGNETCSDFICACYAIDTISPPTPTGFRVAYNAASGNELIWNESGAADIDRFNVRRSGRPDLLLPEPIDTTWTLVHSTPDTFWTDGVPNGWRYRYLLTAVDHVGNESDPAYPESITDAGPRQPPARFALHQNVPNPFNPITTLRFDVPHGTTARLAIYDIRGRLIRVLLDGPVDAGRQSVTWDGRDAAGIPVASGVYFYHLVAPGFGDSRKMIFLR